MNEDNKPSPPNPLVEAGMLLKGFTEHELINQSDDREATTQVAKKVRELLAEAHAAGCLTDDPHRYLAVQQACNALERYAGGEGDVAPERALFDAAVENHQRGPTDVQLGKRRPIKHKKSAKEYFLQAAAVVLWEAYPSDRDQLVSDARKCLGVENREALRRIVDNHHQRHDVDLEKTKSQLSAHIPSVKRLMKSNGWRRLRDFAP